MPVTWFWRTHSAQLEKLGGRRTGALLTAWTTLPFPLASCNASNIAESTKFWGKDGKRRQSRTTGLSKCTCNCFRGGQLQDLAAHLFAGINTLLRAGRDPQLFAPFLTKVSNILTQLDQVTWQDLQTRWTTSSARLLEVAQTHFGMSAAQRNPKLLPQIFGLLEKRREAMSLFLQGVEHLGHVPLVRRQQWQMRLALLALRLNACQQIAQHAIKTDVRDWNAHLLEKLQSAINTHDSREAWSISRQLAGRLFKNPRQPPVARPIAKHEWLRHFQHIQLASEVVVQHTGRNPLCYDNFPGPFPPLFQGEQGQRALAFAASRLQKGRATPRGALPVELWTLLLQGRGPIQPGRQLMPLFEAFQGVGVNLTEWCVGHGCPIPKPGGDASPNGHRVINLLDPIGKVFYKAALDAHPDQPRAHQYGYAARRSRRDAILQISVLLERLQRSHVCIATILYDLTKAFDMLSSNSVTTDLQQDDTLHPTFKALLVDMQQRLQIRLPICGDSPLQVSLGAGVLQGGGTGPRLFRRVYDGIVEAWRNITRVPDSLTEVQYRGNSYDISVAAYADDLARVEATYQLDEVERHAIGHTAALEEVLRPHRLKLNLSKSECLLAIRGKGAYVTAKRAFGGGWHGPPLKSAVKYLGANLQPNLSSRLEVCFCAEFLAGMAMEQFVMAMSIDLCLFLRYAACAALQMRLLSYEFGGFCGSGLLCLSHSNSKITTLRYNQTLQDRNGVAQAEQVARAPRGGRVAPPGTPSATAADLCVLTDGTSPDALAEVSDAEWLAALVPLDLGIANGHSKGSLEQQVQHLTSQLRTVVKVVQQHDRDMREIEAWSCHTYLLSKASILGKELLSAMQAWKSKMPTSGPHPLEAPRWTVAGTVAQVLMNENGNQAQLAKFSQFHSSLSALPDMEQSMQLAVAKETRDHKVLLKIRPQILRQTEWSEATAVLNEIVVRDGGEVKTGAAPSNPLIRQLS
eukprot:s1352_g15.t1